jgi:hypothetical protein
LKLKVFPGDTEKPCVVHELSFNKQILTGEHIKETIPLITPCVSKPTIFTCQIIHQVGSQEKPISKPLTIEWKSMY